jgi:hypothetical protein
MKHRFLIHSLNHTNLLVDISEIGLPAEVFPAQGKPSLYSRFGFRCGNMPSNIFLDWEQRRDH